MKRARRVLCLCGPPAAGKSTAGTLLAAHGVAVFESGEIVASLLGRPPVHGLGTRAQASFRAASLRLAAGPQPTPLVQALRRRIARAIGPVVLVGVRNMSTLTGLRQSRVLDVRVAYMEASEARRTRRYAEREGLERSAYHSLLTSAVETEHDLIRGNADVVVPNEANDVAALSQALRPLVAWVTATTAKGRTGRLRGGTRGTSPSRARTAKS